MAKVKNMRRYGVLAILLVVALVASLFAMMPVAKAAPDPQVTVQMAVCVDGSTSISPTDFALMTTGLGDAVRYNLPQNGTVELTVIQFADNISLQAQVEVVPTVINSAATANTVATAIEGITQAGGWTPTGAAITLATTTMQGSAANWATAGRHIINISTNGYPQPSGEVQNAIDARNAAITAGITEIDAECVGVEPIWQEWMRLNIVYPPQTGGGHYAPPYDPGFVVVVDTFAEYADAIAEKFAEVFRDLKLEPVTDTNCVCETHTLTATLTENGSPVVGEEITFTVTGANPGSGTATTDSNGEAVWSYHGEFVGDDTIVATGGGVTSNEVEKTWIECPPIPGVTVWGIIAAVVVLGGLGVLMLRRRQAYNANRS